LPNLANAPPVEGRRPQPPNRKVEERKDGKSMNVLGLKCFECGFEIEERQMEYLCSRCGKNLEVVYDYNAIKKKISRQGFEKNQDFSIWRYRDFYPLKNLDFRIPLQIGWTSLYQARKLANSFGMEKVWIKDDSRLPSASFKDRASAVSIAKGLEFGFKTICGASTGNAASSTACLCASLGISPVIFVPESAPKAKIAQLLIFGAKVFAVKGSYDQAFDLCIEVSKKYNWYNRNTGYNPYTREGKKNCSYEICEQLGWKVPDIVFVPVGDGNILTGIWKGFKDFYNAGLIDSLPRIVAVQSEGSSAVADAVLGDGKIYPVKANTIADSISVDYPRDGEKAVKAVHESGGTAVKVTDEEILEAIKLLARKEGVFAEPAGVASVAGLRKMVLTGKIKKNEKVVCLITGNGLKDISSALRICGEPVVLDPDPLEVEKEIRKLGII